MNQLSIYGFLTRRLLFHFDAAYLLSSFLFHQRSYRPVTMKLAFTLLLCFSNIIKTLSFPLTPVLFPSRSRHQKRDGAAIIEIGHMAYSLVDLMLVGSVSAGVGHIINDKSRTMMKEMLESVTGNRPFHDAAQFRDTLERQVFSFKNSPVDLKNLQMQLQDLSDTVLTEHSRYLIQLRDHLDDLEIGGEVTKRIAEDVNVEWVSRISPVDYLTPQNLENMVQPVRDMISRFGNVGITLLEYSADVRDEFEDLEAHFQFLRVQYEEVRSGAASPKRRKEFGNPGSVEILEEYERAWRITLRLLARIAQSTCILSLLYYGVHSADKVSLDLNQTNSGYFPIMTS